MNKIRLSLAMLSGPRLFLMLFVGGQVQAERWGRLAVSGSVVE